jgi:hypothetical protein
MLGDGMEVLNDGLKDQMGMNQGTAPLKTMTLWERDSEPQTVDISNVQLPGLKPAANFTSLNLKGGSGEFKPAGKTLDVRFEGLRKARDGSFESFFTFKNTSESLQRTDVLDMHSSSVDIDLHDAEDKTSRHDEVMRPNGNTAIPMNHVGVLPGRGETKFRYRFRPKAGFTLQGRLHARQALHPRQALQHHGGMGAARELERFSVGVHHAASTCLWRGSKYLPPCPRQVLARRVLLLAPMMHTN